jgi:hypothetical protein
VRTLETSRDKFGLPLTFDARLLLGEAQLRSGKRADGIATLRAVERDVSARGAVTFARRASRLLAKAGAPSAPAPTPEP